MSGEDSKTEQETALRRYEGHSLNLATDLNRHSCHQGGTGMFAVSADGVPFE